MILENTIIIHIRINKNKIFVIFSDLADNTLLEASTGSIGLKGKKISTPLRAETLIKSFAKKAYKHGFSQAFLLIEGIGDINDTYSEWITSENIKIIRTDYITPDLKNEFFLDEVALYFLPSESSKIPLKTSDDKLTSDLKQKLIMLLKNTIIIHIRITNNKIFVLFSDLVDNILFEGSKGSADLKEKQKLKPLSAEALIKFFAKEAYESGFSQAFLLIEGIGDIVSIGDISYIVDIGATYSKWITSENIKIIRTKHIRPHLYNKFKV